MNRPLILSLLLLFGTTAFAQPNYLFVKKGIHKKKTYSQGDMIHVQFQNGQQKKGIITMLKDSIIFIDGEPVLASAITTILLNKKKNPFPVDAKTLFMIGAGSALTAIGLSLNDANKPKAAIIAGAVIGFGPLLIKYLGGKFVWALKRKKFRIGKKFRLQVFDIIPPPRRSF